MAKKRISAGDSVRTFGNVCSFVVGVTERHRDEVHIKQYSTELVGPLSVVKARELAAAIIAACDAIDAAPGRKLGECPVCADGDCGTKSEACGK